MILTQAINRFGEFVATPVAKPILRTVRCSSLILLSISIGCQPTETAKKVDPAASVTAEPVRAESFVVKAQTWPAIVRTQGNLVADEVATVGARVAGRVVEVNVDVGDRVAKDQTLLKIDQQEYALLVSQAEAQLTQARSAVGLKPGDPLESLNPENAPPVREARAVWNEAKQAAERLQKLNEQNAVSETDLEVAQAAERVADARNSSALNAVREKIAFIGVQAAELELAKQRLVDTVVRAPFDGTAQGRVVAVGSYVQVGQPLVSLVRTSVLRFRGSVPERFAQSLKVGQEVQLTIDLVKEPRIVKVTRISPALDMQSRSLLFEALVDNSDDKLRSGLFAEAAVVLDPDSKAIVLPGSALVRFAGVDKVWKVIDGQVKDQVVQLGKVANNQVEIIKGVDVGDIVLLDAKEGRQGPYEGKPVTDSEVDG